MLNFRGVSSTNLLEEHKSIATVTRSLRKQQDFLKGWQIKQPIVYGIMIVMKPYCACLHGGLIHSNSPVPPVMWRGSIDSSALRHAQSVHGCWRSTV